MSLKRHIFIVLLFVLKYQVLIVILDLVTLHSLACLQWLLFISPQENLVTSQFDSICLLLGHQYKIAYFLSPRYLTQQVNDLMFIIDLVDCSENTTLDTPMSPTVQNFSSPYFPTHTFRNKTCVWYIVAPKGHFVQVHVKSEGGVWKFSMLMVPTSLRSEFTGKSIRTQAQYFPSSKRCTSRG